MLCLIIFLIVVPTTTLSVIDVSSERKQEAFQLNAAYRKIGSLAIGLHYAHLTSTFHFAEVFDLHASLQRFVWDHHKNLKDPKQQAILLRVLGLITHPTKVLYRLKDTFFKQVEHRLEKRQIDPFGIVGLGLSIYNSVQITQLWKAINEDTKGFEHVLKIFEEDNHAIDTLTRSVNNLKDSVNATLKVLSTNGEQISLINEEIQLMAIIQQHINEVNTWGRGLESILYGELHPTLIDHETMKAAFIHLIQEAAKKGLKPLHEQPSSVFKADLSYIATDDLKIILMVHVPLIRSDPIQLLEYLPIPFELGDMLVTMENHNQILATDDRANVGIELSKSDLLHCKVENAYNGNVYICPNTNLMRVNIKNSCLGALYLGLVPKIIKYCKKYVQPAQDCEDFATQISSTKFVIFVKEQTTILEICPEETRSLFNGTGLKTITAKKGCEIRTESYVFTPPSILKIEADFVDKPMTFKLEIILLNDTVEDIQTAYREIAMIQAPGKRDLGELRTWIGNQKAATNNTWIQYGTIILAVSMSVLILVCFCGIFAYHRCKGKEFPPPLSN